MPEETTRLKSHTIAGPAEDTLGSYLVLDQEVNNLLDQLDNWEIPVNRLMPTPFWPGSKSSPPESVAHPWLLQFLDRTEPAELNGTKDQHLSENLGEDRTKLLSAELFASFEGEKPATPAPFLAGDATNGSRG